MFRLPPATEYVVHSIHDPAVCEPESDPEAYQRTLDPAHLKTWPGYALSRITLVNLTTARRLNLKGRLAGLAAGAADAVSAYYEAMGVKVRACLRAIDDHEWEPDAEGLVPPEALDMLPVDAVEELAGYVDQIAHLDPPGGSGGGAAQ